MADRNRGGRIAPDNRGPQAPGVGKNSKRHDLERRNTPFLHDSDLQQGDVQAMQEGQRTAPLQTQQPAVAPPATGGGTGAPSQDEGIPDPIDFLSGIAGGGVNVPPSEGYTMDNMAQTWLPFVRQLVVGPGSSGLLAGAYINQIRQMVRSPQPASMTFLDMNDVDDTIEFMLDEDDLSQEVDMMPEEEGVVEEAEVIEEEIVQGAE